MAKQTTPNAWDDDWETLADKAEAAADKEPVEDPATMSRAERLARHEEANRKLWKSADEPEEFHFLTANSNVPAGATAFKPTMKVLSRKPAPRVIRRIDPVTGLEQLTIRDDAAEAEAEAAAEAARNQLTPEQRRQQQLREREEKQRKYDEARAKIFGEPLPKSAGTHSSGPSSMSSSRQASPIPPTGGFGTPPQQQGGGGSSSYHHHNNHNNNSGGRGRGRGRGGYRGDNHGRTHDNYNRRQQQQQQQQTTGYTNTTSTPTSAAGTPTRELYDPSYSPKPGPPHLQRSRPGTGNGSSSEASPQPSRMGTPRDDDYVIRTPKGPDGSGRGGFGFARRGG